MIAHPRSRPRRARGQRGAILIITLIVLVAMTLASIAMIRSVDTSTLIAGNLAFKQSATNSADTAVTEAVKFLETSATFDADLPSSGYYATSQDGRDLTGNRTPTNNADDVKWEDKESVVILPKDAAGNEIAYVIHRMCTNAGTVDPATCSTQKVTGSSTPIKPPGGIANSAIGPSGSYSPPIPPGEVPPTPGAEARSVYYRITARVTGPKNNTSFVQAVLLR